MLGPRGRSLTGKKLMVGRADGPVPRRRHCKCSCVDEGPSPALGKALGQASWRKEELSPRRLTGRSPARGSPLGRETGASGLLGWRLEGEGQRGDRFQVARALGLVPRAMLS